MESKSLRPFGAVPPRKRFADLSQRVFLSGTQSVPAVVLNAIGLDSRITPDIRGRFFKDRDPERFRSPRSRQIKYQSITSSRLRVIYSRNGRLEVPIQRVSQRLAHGGYADTDVLSRFYDKIFVHVIFRLRRSEKPFFADSSAGLGAIYYYFRPLERISFESFDNFTFLLDPIIEIYNFCIFTRIDFVKSFHIGHHIAV